MVLIDTSVWIEYLKSRHQELFTEIGVLLRTQKVVVCGVILAELLSGAKDSSVREKILYLRDACNVTQESLDDWLQAGILCREIKEKGRSVGLVDCFLAVIAMKHGMTLWTYDKDFQHIVELNQRLILHR